MEGMSNIRGWIATERKGKITIEYKDIDSILSEDLGYINLVSEVVYQSIYNEDTTDYCEDFDYFDDSMFEEDGDSEGYSDEPVNRHFDGDEMRKLMLFFTGGAEIFELGDRMVFLLEETSPTTIDEVFEHLANIRIGGC